MTTTRIEFSAVGDPDDPTTLIHIEAPGRVLPNEMPRYLNLASHRDVLEPFLEGQAGGDDFVAILGDTLWDCLDGHPNAKDGFSPSLQEGVADRKVTISFRHNPQDVKSLPWEALRVNGDFLTFDKRVPVVREIDSHWPGASPELARNEKLRFLAVIGAEGDTGEGEWNALNRALKSVAGDLDLEVLLISSNYALLEKARAIQEFSIATETIPVNRGDLVHAIERFMPHVAHFFCHGHAEGFLKIEPAGNEYAQVPEIVTLDEVDLEQALLQTACLTVFNACSLAQDGGDETQQSGSLSLCEDLVQKGLPIVVGMRAPVDTGVARRFALNFHRNALQIFRKLLDDGGGHVDLSRGFGDACRAILSGGEQGAERRELSWTLPILHQKSELPSLTRRAVGDASTDLASKMARVQKQAELDTLMAVLEDPPDEYLLLLPAIRAQVGKLQTELQA